MGGFHEHKGIEILLNAFENLDDSNARLMFAGKGEKLEAIEEQYDVSILWFQREQSLTNQLPELFYDSSNLNENIKKLI